MKLIHIIMAVCAASLLAACTKPQVGIRTFEPQLVMGTGDKAPSFWQNGGDITFSLRSTGESIKVVSYDTDGLVFNELNRETTYSLTPYEIENTEFDNSKSVGTVVFTCRGGSYNEADGTTKRISVLVEDPVTRLRRTLTQEFKLDKVGLRIAFPLFGVQTEAIMAFGSTEGCSETIYVSQYDNTRMGRERGLIPVNFTIPNPNSSQITVTITAKDKRITLGSSETGEFGSSVSFPAGTSSSTFYIKGGSEAGGTSACISVRDAYTDKSFDIPVFVRQRVVIGLDYGFKPEHEIVPYPFTIRNYSGEDDFDTEGYKEKEKNKWWIYGDIPGNFTVGIYTYTVDDFFETTNLANESVTDSLDFPCPAKDLFIPCLTANIIDGCLIISRNYNREKDSGPYINKFNFSISANTSSTPINEFVTQINSMLEEQKTDEKRSTDIRLDISNLSYDRKAFDIRYVVQIYRDRELKHRWDRKHDYISHFLAEDSIEITWHLYVTPRYWWYQWDITPWCTEWSE